MSLRILNDNDPEILELRKGMKHMQDVERSFTAALEKLAAQITKHYKYRDDPEKAKKLLDEFVCASKSSLCSYLDNREDVIYDLALDIYDSADLPECKQKMIALMLLSRLNDDALPPLCDYTLQWQDDNDTLNKYNLYERYAQNLSAREVFQRRYGKAVREFWKILDIYYTSGLLDRISLTKVNPSSSEGLQGWLTAKKDTYIVMDKFHSDVELSDLLIFTNCGYPQRVDIVFN